MHMKQTSLSAKQSDLLENLIVKYGQIVTSSQIYEEAASTWDYEQTKNMVTKLVKSGWLVRIKRGLYAISDLSTKGFLTISPLVVASLLLPESYVSFESALSYHGMFDQLSNQTTSVSLKSYKSVDLSGVSYSFVKTKQELFFGWQDVLVGSHGANIAYPEKALIDIVNFRRSQYTIDLVIEKLREHRSDLDLNRLNDYVSKFSITTIKIFGMLFDFLDIDSEKLHQIINLRKGTSWMLTGDSKFNAKWRLYYNDYFDRYLSQGKSVPRRYGQ